MKRFFHNIKIEKIKNTLAHSKRVFFAAYKKRKRIFSLVFISLFLLMGVGIYFQYQTKNAKAAWWNDAWQYRKSIDIANNSTYSTTNKPYRTILDTQSLISTGKMQANGEDFRIVDKNGKTVRFQLEKSTLNTTTTGLWIEASIAAKSSATFYVYYGNSSAPSLTFASDVASVTGDGATIEMKDGYGYSTNTVGMLSDMRKNSVHLGVLSTNRNTTGYPSNWWGGIFTKTLLSQGPLFVEVKNDYGAIGSYSSLGSINKLFSNGFVEEMVYLNYNTSGTDQLYYYLGFDMGTRNSVWINGSGALVDQAPDSPVLTPPDLGDNWFGQRWTATGKYGGTIINKNGTDWVVGNTSAQASYYQTNYSSALAYTPGTSRQIRFGTFAGDGGLAEMREKGSTYGANSSNVGSEEKGVGPVGYWKFDEGNGLVANNSVWKKTGSVTNLVTNPSLESGASGWGIYAGGNVAQSNVASFSGGYSLKFTADGSYNPPRANFPVSVSPSTTYTASVWVKRGQGATAPILNIKTTFNGGETGSVALVGGIANNEWQKISATFTTGAGDNGIFLAPGIGATIVAGDFIYIDAVQLEVGTVANAYCDGSITGNGNHIWNGTTNASTSTCDSGTDGQISGATWQNDAQCVSGKCLKFDGLANNVEAGTNNALDVTGDVTYQAWIKLTPQVFPDATTNWTIFTNESYQNYGSIVRVDGSTQRLYYRTSQVGAYQQSLSTPMLNKDKWYFISVVKSGTSVKMYLDGSEVALDYGSTHSANPADSLRPFYIGEVTQTFNGFIDEPKIYAYARTANQIKQDYNTGVSGMPAAQGSAASFGVGGEKWMSEGLVGYWKMDETSWNGTVGEVKDASGNGLDGKAFNAMTTGSGKFGNGGISDGIDDYIEIADNAVLDPANAVTVSMWFRPDQTLANWQGVLGKGGGSSFEKGYEFANDNGNFGFFVNGDTHIASTTMPASGELAHWVGTYDGKQIKLYKNGKLITTTDYVGTIVDTTLPFRIARPGEDGGNDYFTQGMYDEVRVYNRALSSLEVSQLYDYAPDPVAFWNFENDTPTFIKDKSTSKLNLTVSGNPTFSAGKFGDAMNCAGGTETATSPVTSILDNDYHTIAFWIRFNQNSPSRWSKIFTYASQSSDRSPGIWTYPDVNCLHWRYNNGNTGPTSCGGPTGENSYFTNGQWYYITGVKEGALFSFYVDGKKIESGAVANPKINGPSTITLFNPLGPLISIDEMKVYDYARTQKQILEDMNSGNPASEKPVTFWKFDEGSGATVNNIGTLGSANNGVINGATWTNDGKIGKALTFSTNQYVMIPNDPLKALTQLSLSAWVKPSGAMYIFQHGASSAQHGFLNYFAVTAAGALSLDIEHADASAHFIPSSATGVVPMNSWSYVSAIVRDKSVDFYVNGARVSSTAFNGMYPLSTTWDDYRNIGRQNYNGGASISHSSGMIDEVKIFNYPLSDSDIASEYNQGSSVTMASAGISAGAGDNAAKAQYCIPGDASTCNFPVAEWNFDEKTGTTIKDTSGNSYNGTLINGSWTTGKTGSAILFNGTPGSATHINGPDISIPTDITAEAWIYSSDYNQSGFIVSKNPVNTQWELFVVANNLHWRSQADSSNDTVYQAPSVNKWHHIAVTQAGTLTKMYIDGMLVDSKTTVAIGNSAGNIEIGSFSDGGSYQFAGKIDGVKLYDYARTPAQIAYDYNRGAPIGWWKMDECRGSTIFDASGKGNNGTLTIGAAGAQTVIGTCEAASSAWGKGKLGKYSSSLNFDGTDDYISKNSSINTGQDFSVFAWVKPQAAIVGRNMFITNGYPFLADKGWLFGIQNDNSFAISIGQDNAWANSYAGVVTNGQWNFIGATVTNGGASFNLYANGKLVASYGVNSARSISYSDPTFYIATRTGEFFNGQADDVRIYNYVLTPEQISNVMNEGSALRFGQ
jgi:hypothetical protein